MQAQCLLAAATDTEMTTWVLLFFISHGFAQAATGGPAVIDGFTSEAKCQVVLKQIEQRRGFDYAVCMKVEK